MEATRGTADGFGELWRKRYRLRFEAIADPAELTSRWRAGLSSFWPNSTHLASAGRLRRGRALLLHVATPVGHMETGLVVESLTPTSFRFRTVRGHMFAGTVTCLAGIDDSGAYADVVTLFRTSDPLFEAGFKLGGGRYEDWFWTNTLGNLAKSSALHGRVWLRRERLDRRRNWRSVTNLRHNAAIRTAARRVAEAGRALLPGRPSEEPWPARES